MRMFQAHLTAVATAAIILASCTPPPPVPPPRFTPNPPYPPTPVDPYTGQPDPYGNPGDVSPPQPTTPEIPTRPGEYPVARKTAKPGEVISPYEPYNIIDVSEFTSGQLARDPSNKKIFRVP
jgi:hypothetical protein